MTKISKALSPEQVSTYYKRDLGAGSGERNYYAKGGEDGEWLGAEARAFGLYPYTPVTEEAITRLAMGQDPCSGLQLIEWRKPAVIAAPNWTDDATWRKHLEATLGVRADSKGPDRSLPSRALGGERATSAGFRVTDDWEASQVPIRQLWRDLGGPEIKGNRSTAFWRGGDGLSISIDAEKGIWHDFVAGEGGGTIKLAATVLGVSNSEAARYLREQYTPGLNSAAKVNLVHPLSATQLAASNEGEKPVILDPERRAALLEMHTAARELFAANLASDTGAGARMYLKDRGIKPATIAEFGVGLSSDSGRQLVEKLKHYGPELMDASGLFVRRGNEFHDRFRGRLMFPIENAAGETIAFGGRKPPGSELGPKYVNSPETELYTKGDELFGLSKAKERIEKTGKVIIVEGYLDALAAHQAGQRNTVAASGTALSETQASTLAQHAKTAILNLDGDDAGRLAAGKHIAKLLDAGLDVRALDMAGDPAEFVAANGAPAYRKAIKEAAPLIEYLAERAKEKPDGSRWMLSTLEHVRPEHRPAIAAQLEARLKPAKEEPEEKKEPVEHRAAWDMTLSAPKTVSLTALVGGDARVIAAHDEAVKEALGYAERYLQVKMGGLNAPQTTQRMVAALFRHDTARPVEGYAAPQLHTHAVIFNMSQDRNGQYRALNPRELFYIQGAAEAVYQNRLAVKLKSFGYELEYGKNLAIEVQGYTAEYREAESPRTTVIEAEKKRLGMFGPQADQNIALNTRAAKLNQTPDEVKAMHREHAEKFGQQADKVVDKSRDAKSVTYSPEYRSGLADEAITFAKSRLSERTTVMEDHEIHRDALRFGRGYVTLPDVERAFTRKRDEFVKVDHWREYAPGQRWTTPELQAKERYVLGWMADGRGKVEAIAPKITKDEFRERFRDHLNDGQKHLVWNLIHSRDRLVGVQGLAGTGKTRALATLRDFTEAYGYEVRGLAATSSAVAELRDVGLQAQTLASFLLEKQKQVRPRAYFLDESSLIDVEQSARFLERLKPADRVIVIGDKQQHGSLGAGKVFAELQDAGMLTFHLKKVVRQKPAEYREVVENLSAGQVSAALGKLEDQKRIQVHASERERFAAIAREYLTSPAKTLVVSPDNRSRVALAEAIREARQEAGQMGANAYRTRTLHQRSDVGETDLKFAPSYRVGDVVAYARDSKVGINRGDYASVVNVDRDKNLLTVIRESDGALFSYDPRRTAGAASLYEPVYREFAIGDRVQFTRAQKVWGVANRSLGTIEALDDAGNIGVRMDRGGKRVDWNLEQMPHLEYGYVMTSYSSQGATADKVIVHMDTDAPGVQKLLNQQLIYVAASRGRDDVQLFVNDREELDRYLSRSEEKATALAPAEVQRYQVGAEMSR